MSRCLALAALGALLALTGCSEQATDTRTDASEGPLGRVNVDPARVTVSGLSSGGFMASQLHLAHSETFAGAGIIAAGPWWCSQGDISRALGVCTKGGDFEQDVALDYAGELADGGLIDPLDNLQNDRVWLFSGSKDEAVASAVVEAADAFYGALLDPNHVSTNLDLVPATHGLPTLDHGLGCDEFATPFINACSYDLAGEMLRFLNNREQLEAPGEPTGELLEVPVPGAKDASLTENAFVYVPSQCAAGTPCGVHVALHGCQQSFDTIGDAYVLGAGYNRWADALDLLIVYPQVASSSLMPMNPLGCWDWWGYSTRDYVVQSAPQIAAIKALLDTFSGPRQ